MDIFTAEVYCSLEDKCGPLCWNTCLQLLSFRIQQL